MKIFAILVLFLGSHAWGETKDETIYKSMRSTEMMIQYGDVDGGSLVGASVFEKSEANVLCLKSTSGLPHSKPNFNCYNQSAPSDAEENYEKMAGAELYVRFRALDGSPVNGSQTFEKQVDNEVCRRQGAMVTNAIFSYRCYSK